MKTNYHLFTYAFIFALIFTSCGEDIINGEVESLDDAESFIEYLPPTDAPSDDPFADTGVSKTEKYGAYKVDTPSDRINFADEEYKIASQNAAQTTGGKLIEVSVSDRQLVLKNQ